MKGGVKMKQSNTIKPQVVDFGELLKQIRDLPEEQSTPLLYYIKGVVETYLYQNQTEKE